MKPSIQHRHHVQIVGDGATDLVFAHGFGCDQNMWRLVAPAFEDRYRIVLYDLVGSGRSDLSAYDRRKYATLAGHVTLGNWVILGGMTAVHQFCAVGVHAMAAGGSIVLRDVPPYVICSGNPAEPHGINTEGLKRRGFDPNTISLVRRAYKTLSRDGLTVADAVSALGVLAEENPPSAPAILLLKDFVQSSQRGIVR